jgi:adenylate kinase family enzyme
MKRVLVVGSGGAGKSTLARRLGGRLGVEVIHLDRFYWRAEGGGAYGA